MAKEIVKLNTEVYKLSPQAKAITDQLTELIGFNPIEHALVRANVINTVAQWLEFPEISKILEQMEGSSLGFVTDMDTGTKYSPKVRAQCVTDALLQGIRPDSNEFNIIRSKMMVVQNGWRRLVSEMGHDELKWCASKSSKYKMIAHDCHETGEPIQSGNMISIPMCIKYVMLNKETKKSEKGAFTKTITLTIKSKDTVDTWIGKCERRIFRSFFRLYSGEQVLDDDTAGEFTGGTAKPGEDIPKLGDEQKPTTKMDAPEDTADVDTETGEVVDKTLKTFTEPPPEDNAPPEPPDLEQTVPADSPAPAVEQPEKTSGRPTTNF